MTRVSQMARARATEAAHVDLLEARCEKAVSPRAIEFEADVGSGHCVSLAHEPGQGANVEGIEEDLVRPPCQRRLKRCDPRRNRLARGTIDEINVDRRKAG